MSGAGATAGFAGEDAKAAEVVRADAALLERLAALHPAQSSLFGSARWTKALASTYGFGINAALLGDVQQPRAALLFSEVDDIRGRRIISLPFSDYLDPIVRSEADWRQLVKPLLELAAPVRLRTLDNAVPWSDQRFEQRTSALWHAADLRPDEKALWAGVKDSAPRNIRRAEHNGITVTEGRTLDDLRHFYELHFGVRKRKYGLFTQPFSFFENIFEAFAPDDRLVTLLARHEGKPVAGILFLIEGDTLFYKFNASADLRFRPNDLLIWTGMLMGKRLGLTSLDFGLSDLAQPGLVRFKRKFASLERPIRELRWTPEGFDDPRGRAASATLGHLTELLTAPDVPDHVTRSAGDELYRFFA